MTVTYAQEGADEADLSQRCTDLQKVHNLDEMLYQFYSHLDGDCLFTTPLDELEKAWGISILSKDTLQQGQNWYKLRDNAEYGGKPYHTEADAFFVEVSHENGRTKEFSIAITQAYSDAHITLFPDGNFPKLLPPPVEAFSLVDTIYHISPSVNQKDLYPKNRGKYRDSGYVLYWMNKDQTHMIYLVTRFAGSVSTIKIYDRIPTVILKEIKWNEEINNGSK